MKLRTFSSSFLHFSQVEILGGPLKAGHVVFFKDDNVSVGSGREQVLIVKTESEGHYGQF